MEMNQAELQALEGALCASEGVVLRSELAQQDVISAPDVDISRRTDDVVDTAPKGTAAEGTVANLRGMIEKSEDDSNKPKPRFGSQDELDSPHLEALKSAISSFNARTIDDMGKKSMWTSDTIIDSQKFRNPLHYLVESYGQAMETQMVSNQSFSECLSVMTSHGLDINETDVKRNTPLHLLCHFCGVDDVIKILLASGAKVNLVNIHQQTPLHLATDNGTTKDVETLLEGGADPNLVDCNGMGPLHNAVKYRRNRETIKYLVGCGAVQDLQHVENRARTGSAPLHTAVRQDRRENVKLLLELGAETEVRDSSGQTPLHLAAKYDITGDMVRYLVEGGAHIDSRDAINHETPLHKAIRRNMVENVMALTRLGASTAKPDNNGDSALHCAATWCQNIEIWMLLMTSPRVDIDVRNAKGKTVLEHASRTSNKLAVNILKQVDG